MKTSSQFSLSQHLWQCHPDSEESKKRSLEYKKQLEEAAKKYKEEQGMRSLLSIYISHGFQKMSIAKSPKR